MTSKGSFLLFNFDRKNLGQKIVPFAYLNEMRLAAIADDDGRQSEHRVREGLQPFIGDGRRVAEAVAMDAVRPLELLKPKVSRKMHKISQKIGENGTKINRYLY